jgi:hypothetical protein
MAFFLALGLGTDLGADAMPPTFAGCLIVGFGCVFALGDEPGDRAAVTSPETAARAASAATAPAPAPAESPPNRPVLEPMPERVSAADVAAAKAETAGRLQSLAQPDDQADPASSRELKEILERRLHWLQQWEMAVQARNQAEHPPDDPEKQAAKAKADLERAQALLEQAAKDPSRLLPERFRVPDDRATGAMLAELKEAIDAVQGELEKLSASGVAQTTTNNLAKLRDERDEVRHDCARLAAKRSEREQAVKSAANAAARDLARERLINLEWEARANTEWLIAKEAALALETKRAAAAELELQLMEVHRQLTRKTLEMMQRRYSALAERQQLALKRAAAHEEDRAAKSNDPLERFRARRAAELLELKGQLLKDQRTLASSPSLSPEDQAERADRAEQDFAKLRKLVKDGHSSALVAIRLKNDFRRLSHERALVARTDLARSANETTYYENALTAVELELVNDAQGDRLLLENLLEVLPVGRHPEAIAVYEQQEAERRALLEQRRKVLDDLVNRAERTHQEVLRRLRALDAEYTFVRTHIFWVRDAEPLGPKTLGQGQTEVRRVARAVFRVGLEACDFSLWGRLSAEFALLALGALVLPWPIWHARRSLNHWLERALAALAEPLS